MKIVVNGRWVAIDEAAPDTATAGGILIPEKAQKPYPYGTIVGVGAKCEGSSQVGEVTIFDQGMKHVLRNPRTGKELVTMLHEESLFITMDQEAASATGFIVSHKTLEDCMGVNMAEVVLPSDPVTC